jgi:TatD DNase family protein
MYVDTHAHLNFAEFAADLPQIVERAQAADVGRIVSIATDLDGGRQTLAIAQRFPHVFAAVGLHPNNVPDSTLCDMKELAALAGEPKIVAIGETGLDYYREAKDDASRQQQQKDLFWAHLALARERRLPIIIHSRGDTQRDLLEILRAHAESLPKDWHPWGVMHCFAGDERLAFDCIEIGLFISFTGILTFKNAGSLRDVAKKASLDHVMLETDAPYLAPVPYRGQRNEPSYIPHIASVLAEIKGVPVSEVARATTANAERLFGFS